MGEIQGASEREMEEDDLQRREGAESRSSPLKLKLFLIAASGKGPWKELLS